MKANCTVRNVMLYHDLDSSEKQGNSTALKEFIPLGMSSREGGRGNRGMAHLHHSISHYH